MYGLSNDRNEDDAGVKHQSNFTFTKLLIKLDQEIDT